MKYSGSLVKKEREQIFQMFLHEDRLRFSDIEKQIKIRSNMIAYHLQQMVKEGLLKKERLEYQLTKKGEKYIPIFSHITGSELSPLPIALIATMHKSKILLIKRNKRPYKNYWSMIGGKMLFDEDYKKASIRLVKNRSSLEAKFASINAILHEMVEDEGIKHSFILFFTKVNVDTENFKVSNHGELKFFDIKKLDKLKIIPSDYWLIKHKLNSKITVHNATMKDDSGVLKDFIIR
jgi:ADP-ribose pyrophosphatase YjhB (NUDIX family)